MNQIELNIIATRLKATARAEPGVAKQHQCPDGLTITLIYNAAKHTWALSLTRWCRHASQEEKEVCRWAFKIPETADWETTITEGWQITRYVWTADGQKPSPIQASFEMGLEPIAGYSER